MPRWLLVRHFSHGINQEHRMGRVLTDQEALEHCKSAGPMLRRRPYASRNGSPVPTSAAEFGVEDSIELQPVERTTTLRGDADTVNRTCVSVAATQRTH